MRKKILKSKYLHITYERKTLELFCDLHLSHPDDFNNENGIKCIGIWDTGSEGCLISSTLAKKLNLPHIGFKRVIGVNKVTLSPEYFINIFLPDGPNFEVVSALVAENIGEDEILIGMSIINQGDFAVTNVNKRTAMSYRTPSIERINFENDYKKAVSEEEKLRQKRRKDTRGSQKSRKRRKPR